MGIISRLGLYRGSAQAPLSGLRIVTTLPQKDFFGGNNLVRARGQTEALRGLGAVIYEFDTASIYSKDLSRIEQQKRDIIEFRPDVAVSTPHAGYIIQGCSLAEPIGGPGASARNLFIDDLEIPVVLFWDHAITQAANYLFRPSPNL